MDLERTLSLKRGCTLTEGGSRFKCTAMIDTATIFIVRRRRCSSAVRAVVCV
jgi:hypothetical protein